MPVVTFAPGPSKVPDHLSTLYTQAFQEGIPSISHRGPQFEAAFSNAVNQLREKLDVPADYKIFFVGSATEAWGIFHDSLVKHSALHLHNGAFGGKWAAYCKYYKPELTSIQYGPSEDPAPLLAHLRPEHEAICLTHNETSNATMLETSFLEASHAAMGPDRLVFVDVTSSMAGISLPWHLGDVWFASAQKCLAIPAGLAVIICGPRALAKAHEIGAKHYNSIPVMEKYAANNQTSYTPNVLSIYILGQHLMRTAPVRESEVALYSRAARYYAAAEAHNLLTPLIKRKANQSPTVIAIEAKPDTLSRMKAAALSQGLMLGNGYIPWKDTTFRIANFPAYTDEDQARVLAVLESVQ